jgi:protein-L-isoaspartate(D-aspartate) O-methyltransferase
MIDFERARQVMVDNQLRTSGITDHRLLIAMSEVPRERFISGPRHTLAYIDAAQPISQTRRMAAPAAFARLVQLAQIEHTDRVLDLGCGTGYSTAVLARLAAEVTGVEDEPDLAARARTILAELGIGNAAIMAGPLASTGASGAPYDVVVVEGVVDAVPPQFLALLKPEGRLVAATAEGGRPAVAHLFVNSGKGVAASAAFDASLPLLTRPANPDFVF